MGPLETLLFLLAAKTLAAPLDGHEATNKPVVKDGILQLPLFGVAAELETVNGKLTKRQVSVEIDRQKFRGSKPVTALGIPLEIGTPPQTVVVEPDTGSSKFWVPGLRADQDRDGPISTFFDQEASRSKQDLAQKEVSNYQSEFAVLDVFLDELAIGGQSLGASRIGVASMSESRLSRDVGTLGLLTPKDKDRWADDFLLKKLMDRNIVRSRAFSAGVRTLGQGSLTFGGYDTAKFSGSLEKFPMKPTKHNHYVVEMQSLSLSHGGRNKIMLDQSNVNGRPLTIGLDSGAPGLQLSMDVFKDVQTKLGADVKNRLMTVPCGVVDSGAALDFKMSNSTTVSVLLADLLYARLDNGKRCQVVITFGGRTADLWIGVQYLRRSYIVYDPDNSNVYVARGADCGSNLVPINGAMADDVVGACAPETPHIDLPVQNAHGSRPKPPQGPGPQVQDLRPEDIRMAVDPRVEFEGDE